MSQVWGVLDRLRAERHPLVHADQVDAKFLGLLEDGEGHLRVVHPPWERRSVVVAHVVELERLRAELADLAGLGPGDPVTEFGQFRDKVCCAGVAVPGADPGTWWALGTSARGLDLPGPLLGELQFAATDLTP
jgi:hypothetical protein